MALLRGEAWIVHKRVARTYIRQPARACGQGSPGGKRRGVVCRCRPYMHDKCAMMRYFVEREGERERAREEMDLWNVNTFSECCRIPSPVSPLVVVGVVYLGTSWVKAPVNGGTWSWRGTPLQQERKGLTSKFEKSNHSVLAAVIMTPF